MADIELLSVVGLMATIAKGILERAVDIARRSRYAPRELDFWLLSVDIL